MKASWMALALAFVAGPAGATVVELVNVPPRLELPLPPGTNRLLEVRVTGGAPRAVWLATGEGGARVRLDRTAKGWAVNLGDPALVDALGGGDRFRVYAEMPDGTVAASVPVLFARRAADARWTAVIAGEPRALGPGAWLAPARVDRFEATGAAGAVARVGRAAWTFTPSDGRLVLAPPPDLRSRWAEAGTLLLVPEGGPALEVRAVPTRLEPGAVTVHQRASAEIPSSFGYLTLSLDDVTAGQVLVTVQAADGQVPVPRRSMRQGDAAPLGVGTAELRLERLVNLFAGDDYAEFRVLPAADADVTIDALLRAVEASDARFLRGGQVYDGRAAAAHLRRKLEGAPPGSITTVDAFIEHVGSRSSTSGEVYRVRTPDGREVPAGEWLRALAAGLKGG